jgi:Ser/Thr protein kinase RdoA (MazF antagonist)
VLDEEALLRRVLVGYDMPAPEACRFLCRGDADIYRATAAGTRFYLKVYRPPHTGALAEAEARLVTGLSRGGVPVVLPVPLRKGGFACEVRAREGVRPMLLFEEAPPPLEIPVEAETCRDLGRATARLHEAADALTCELDLPLLDWEALVARWLPHITPFLSDADVAFLEDLSGRARSGFEELPARGPGFGPCHADLVVSNFRRDPERGITIFDFGAAARCCRAFDLAVPLWSLDRRRAEERDALGDALLSGYEEVRSLPEGLTDRLPVLLIARHISFLGGNCGTLPLRLGTEPFEGDFLEREMGQLRRLAEALPGPD